MGYFVKLTNKPLLGDVAVKLTNGTARIERLILFEFRRKGKETPKSFIEEVAWSFEPLKMGAELEIHHGRIPREVIKDFETNIDKSISLRLYHEHGEGRVDHFEEAADILIFINAHLTELIVSITGSLVYDGIKYAVKGTWKKLRDHYSKQKKEYQEGQNCIELSLKIGPDKTIECTLAGNVAPESIDMLTDKMFEYIKDKERQKKDFDEPDFRSDTKPRIRIRYNPETNQYEPVNFGEMRKRDEELS
jgi:hypothetical protein